jgi:ribonuclease HI
MSKYDIICDGGSRGNHTGLGGEGYGSFIILPDICPQRFFQSYGKGITNNDAEYLVVLAALDYLKNILNVKNVPLNTTEVEIHTDSQLVVGHMTQNWRVKASNLIDKVSSLSAFVHEFTRVTFTKEPREVIVKHLGH